MNPEDVASDGLLEGALQDQRDEWAEIEPMVQSVDGSSAAHSAFLAATEAALADPDNEELEDLATAAWERLKAAGERRDGRP